MAPTADGEEWTLDRALARAVEANPDVLAAKYEVERQEGARLQVRARLLPTVDVSASLNQRGQGLVDVQPSRRGDPPTADTAVALFGYDVSVEVRQTLFDGFSSWNAAKRQSLVKKQSYLSLVNVVAQTVSLVREGFDAILLRTAGVAAEKSRVDEYAQLVDVTSRKSAVGDIPEFELLRAEAELEGAKADLAEATRSLGQAQQSFRRLLQISSSAGSLKIEGKFEPRMFDLPLDRAIELARANRPDLQAAAVAVEAARRELLSDAGGNFPKFQAFASYGGRSSYFSSAIQLKGWTYGVIGQWNLFEGGAARGRRMSLRADQRGAESKLAQTEQGIISRLHELYQSLEQSRVALEAQSKGLSLAARASRDARRQYDVGSASLDQVLQASITFRRSQTRMNEAIYNYNSIVAEIELSVGGRISDSLRVPETWKP